jgi:hypothetical protein
MSEFEQLFDTITAQGKKPFESGPFRFFGILKPIPVPRNSKADLTFVCKNVGPKNARAEIQFIAPRKKGLRWENSEKNNISDMLEFTPNQVKGYVLPMICNADAKPGLHMIHIWVDYKYSGQSVVRTLVGARHRGMQIMVEIQ